MKDLWRKYEEKYYQALKSMNSTDEDGMKDIFEYIEDKTKKEVYEEVYKDIRKEVYKELYEGKYTAGEQSKRLGVAIGQIGCKNCGCEALGAIHSNKCDMCGESLLEEELSPIEEKQREVITEQRQRIDNLIKLLNKEREWRHKIGNKFEEKMNNLYADRDQYSRGWIIEKAKEYMRELVK